MSDVIERRDFVKSAVAAGAMLAVGGIAGCAPANNDAQTTSAANSSASNSTSQANQSTTTQQASGEKAIVYFTPDISPTGLIAIYQALGRQAEGKVAVKVSTGEPGGNNYLKPELIADLVHEVNGTIVECNTAYGGPRATTESHLKAAADHGFTAIADVEIMDADGDVELPVANGKHLDVDYVGAGLMDYDFLVNLAHFKGHAMAGFGGVIKNASIGIASSQGKSYIHSAGAQRSGFGGASQDAFLESMGEAAKAVADHFGDNVVYIDVMNNLSVDCDCDSHPAAPTMDDVGILGSFDPVALDKACVDLVYADANGGDLIKRMESRNGLHTLDYAEQIGLGTQSYELVEV